MLQHPARGVVQRRTDIYSTLGGLPHKIVGPFSSKSAHEVRQSLVMLLIDAVKILSKSLLLLVQMVKGLQKQERPLVKGTA